MRSGPRAQDRGPSTATKLVPSAESRGPSTATLCGFLGTRHSSLGPILKSTAKRPSLRSRRPSMPKRVAIVGATGYAGVELTTILARHSEAQLVALFSSSNGARGPVSPSHPTLIAEPFTREALLAAN